MIHAGSKAVASKSCGERERRRAQFGVVHFASSDDKRRLLEDFLSDDLHA